MLSPNERTPLTLAKRERSDSSNSDAPNPKKIRKGSFIKGMHFNSKPEAYTYIIYILTQWQDSYPDGIKQAIANAVKSIKIAYENHEQNIKVVLEIVQCLPIKEFQHFHQEEIGLLISNLCSIKENKTNDNNLLPRRFESELASFLIKTPTKTMMSSIHLVSQSIIRIINEYKEPKPGSKEEKIINFFLSELEGSDIVFGCFKEKPTLEKAIAILEANNPNDFIKIQFISFMFARSIIGPLPLNNLPAHAPTSLFASILERYLKANPSLLMDGQTFSYQQMAAEKEKVDLASNFRTFIFHGLFYGDELYTQGHNRGRLGPRKTHLNTNQLGLMKLGQSAHSQGLPVISGQLWCADAQAQEAQEDSIYYQTALENDCPYITGPSGMTGLFMNMLFQLLNPQEIELVQAYSLGVIAYIVGAGFHSVNEILIPLVKCINMLPEYPAYDGLEYLRKPPLYNLYFTRIGQIDPEFNELRDQVWESYLAYFASCYMPLCRGNFCDSEKLTASPCLFPEVEALKQIVAVSTENCILYHKENGGYDCRFLGLRSQELIFLEQLREACASQSSLPAIMAQLQKYFSGQIGEATTSMHKFDNRSYLRFFLNTLKDYPQVLSHINEQLKLTPPLIIDLAKDLFSPEYRMESFKIHKILKEELKLYEKEKDCNKGFTNY